VRERADWLTNGVRGIGAASFLSDLGHEVPTALLPRLLTQTFGASAAALGIIEGLADGLAGFFRFLGGALADDPDRRRDVAVGGYTATAVLSAGIGAATTVWQVGLLRAGGWAARGLRVPARNALLADAVPADAYGRAYGFERTMDNLGAVAGPLLALALISLFDVRTAILISVIPGLLAALAILYAVRHLPRLQRRERQPIQFHVRAVLRGRLGRLMVGVSLFEVGNVAVTLLILRATDLLTPQRGLESATFVALLFYLAYNVAATLVSLPAGHASDRIGSVRVLRLGIGAFLFAYVLFAASGPSIPVLLLAFVLAGIGIGGVETAEQAVVAGAAPLEVRGSAFGMLAAVQSFGNLAASVGVGLIWSFVSPVAAFAALAVLMAASVVALSRSRRERLAGPRSSGSPHVPGA
jgi:MFS family permease